MCFPFQPSLNITDGVDSSLTEYIFFYGTGSPFPVSTDSAPQCTYSSCQHTFNDTSSQAQQYTVSVAARNVVGVGNASTPVIIGMWWYRRDVTARLTNSNIATLSVSQSHIHSENRPFRWCQDSYTWQSQYNYVFLKVAGEEGLLLR